MYQFPLDLQFKRIALAPQISVRDASGAEVLYVHQKLFKLKEAIQVFTDRSKSQVAYRIAADRVLDVRARYLFTDAEGRDVGSVKRLGMKSILKATYEIHPGGGDPADPVSTLPTMRLEEENPWVKAGDALLGEIPVVGLFTGYFLHPRYRVVSQVGDQPLFRVTKKPAFTESRFRIERLAPEGLSEEAERAAVLGILTMALLERSRG